MARVSGCISLSFGIGQTPSKTATDCSALVECALGMDAAVPVDDAAALAEWDAPIRDVVAYTGKVAGHPGFAQAVRTLGGNMLSIAASDRALDGVFKDAGRYVVAMFAVYLDVTGGVTLPALKEICARSGYLSPGRARATAVEAQTTGAGHLRCQA